VKPAAKDKWSQTDVDVVAEHSESCQILVAKGHRYPKYVCSTYGRSGKNNPNGCGCLGVAQDLLVDVLVRKLQQVTLSQENLEKVRKLLLEKVEKQRIVGAQGTTALRKQIADLDREIDRAADNFLRAPAEVLDLISKKLTGLKRQRESLQDELRANESTANTGEGTAKVNAAIDRLWRLGEEIGTATPARRREVFRQLVDRIELRFDRIAKGKRTECPLKSGEIHLRTGEGSIFGSVSRGDRI
jgi:hypothetical protein